MPSQWSLLLHVRRRKFRRLVFSCRCAPHRHGFFSTWLPAAPVAAGSPRKSGSPLILSLRSTPPRILLHLASSCSCCRGLADSGMALRHGGGAFELVPGKRFAVDGALECLQQDGRKQLAIGKALQPYVKQKPHILAPSLVPPFQEEGEGGSNEVNDQENHEEQQQLLKAAGVVALGMEITHGQVIAGAEHEHEVDRRREQRQHDLKDNDIGQREPA